MPFLERCLPKEILTPVALEESVREQVTHEFDDSINNLNDQSLENQSERSLLKNNRTK